MKNKRRRYTHKTDDGRYGLTAKGELWKIAGQHSYVAGYVMDAENIEYAADQADEESRILFAQAAEEFGW